MRRWFVEKISLKTKKGKNKYNEPVFNDEVEIVGKVEDVNKLVKNAQGEEIVTTMVVFTGIENNIKIGDYVLGHEVVDVKKISNFKGKPKFIEVLAK